MDEDASYPPFTHAIYMFAYNYGELVCAISAIVFTASCVWLMVRIVNRRERWAKRTLAGVIGIPVLYVASFGPACWLDSRVSGSGIAFQATFRPLIWVADHVWPNAWDILRSYAILGMPDDGIVFLSSVDDDFPRYIASNPTLILHFDPPSSDPAP